MPNYLMPCENNKYIGFLGVPRQLAGRAFRYIIFCVSLQKSMPL